MNKDIPAFPDRNIKWFINGQPRPYTDTLRSFECDALDEADAIKAIQELGYNTKNQTSHYSHKNGASSFPFGMESFFSVVESKESKGRFVCTVTEPYTG